MKSIACKNCSSIYNGNFCPNCGQSSHETRINAHYFLHDIPHSIFHVDGGFFNTLKMLFSKPGLMIEEFLEGKRIRYFRPFGYVMVMTAVSTFLTKMLEWSKYQLLQTNTQIIPVKNYNFFEHYFSIFIFLMIPVASFVTWFFFFNKKYNFWEHILVNTYISAQLNIIWILSYLINFFIVLFTGKVFEMKMSILFIFFMMVFLYLYGSVFGYLFRKDYKIVFLTILLTVMNFLLFMIYYYGFIWADLIN